MARGRMISCAIATDEDFNNMSVDAQFLFMRAVPHLDRDGLVSGTLNSLWAKIAPLLPQYISRMGGIVNEWVEHDFVVRYRDGKREVLFFKGFCKNQANMRYDREAESIFSPPPGYKRTERGLQIDDKSAGGNGAGGSDSDATKSNAGAMPEQCRSNAGVTPDEEKLREENLREGNTTTTPLPPTQTANSGGGGGDATAANQTTQISEAQTTNNLLLESTSGYSAAQLLGFISNLLNLINTNGATSANQGTTNRLLQLINGGETGSKLFTTDLGTVTGLALRKLVVNEDCVLSTLRDANGNDLISLYNLSGKTLKQGSVLVVYDSSDIEQLRVTSGSIFGYGE